MLTKIPVAENLPIWPLATWAEVEKRYKDLPEFDLTFGRPWATTANNIEYVDYGLKIVDFSESDRTTVKHTLWHMAMQQMALAAKTGNLVVRTWPFVAASTDEKEATVFLRYAVE